MPYPVTTRFRAPLEVGLNDLTMGSLYVKIGTLNPATGTDQLIFTVPAGSRIVGVIGLGGATGGSSPTVDIGIAGALDTIANELPSSPYTYATSHAGANMGVRFTTATAIRGRVGASAASGGTWTGAFLIELAPGFYEPSGE